MVSPTPAQAQIGLRIGTGAEDLSQHFLDLSIGGEVHDLHISTIDLDGALLS